MLKVLVYIPKFYGRFDLALLEVEFQKQKSVCHVIEVNRRWTIGSLIKPTVTQIQRKSCFYPHHCRKNKRKLTRETFYLINNNFKQLN